MFRVETNATEVATALKRVTRDLRQFAHKDATNIGQITESGIASHFDKLGGGGPDPSALGGGVSWSTARSDLTKKERGSKFPLLKDSGHMRGAFTDGAVKGGATNGRGSRFVHTASDSTAIQRGLVHQEGRHGYHAIFPKTGRTKVMDIPARPFLYWDSQMVDRVFARAQKYFDESVKRHEPKELGQ